MYIALHGMAFHYIPLHPAAALENPGASPAAGRIQVRPAALCGGDIAAWMFFRLRDWPIG